MTDKEIIKALDYCKDCCANINIDIIDLINRLQADIERLKNKNEILSINADTAFQDGLNEAQGLYAEQVKAEVIKEFAERLKDRIVNSPSAYPIENATLAFLNGSSHRQLEILEIIDKLIKEMVGD